MSTSGTYNFSSPYSLELITDAYERAGIKPSVPDPLTYYQMKTAQRSANLILNSWINRGLNLWTVNQQILGLNFNQSTYLLPPNTSDIIGNEACIRTAIRNLGGTPHSTSGVAGNAFDNNSLTACTQTAPNGNISYNWPNTSYAISMVGILSFTTQTYDLVVETSTDNATWTQVYAALSQSYPQGNTVWLAIPVPTLSPWIRIREIGGATLNIAEIYFDTAQNDTVITRMSRAEYLTYPTKQQLNKPNMFWVNRQINPTVTLYPVPTQQYNMLVYNRVLSMQDIGSLQNAAQIPARFLEAFTAELAFMLGIKNPDLDLNKLDRLEKYSEREFNKAAREDREPVPLRIYPDTMSGWGR